METYADENVVIRRVKPYSSGKSEKDSGNGNASKKSKFEERSSELEEKNVRVRFKIMSILLFALSIFIFLSLLSYNTRDEAATQIAFSDLMKLLAGDELVRAKFESVYNWLGVVGALVSNFLYNSTFGYVILLFPIILGFYAKDLFFRFSISENLIKKTSQYLMFATLFCATIGVLQQISVFSSIPKEWSGAIGMFIAATISSVIGVAGATILVIMLWSVFVILIADIQVGQIFDKVKSSDNELIRKIAAAFSKFNDKYFSKIKAQFEINDEEKKTETPESQDDEKESSSEQKRTAATSPDIEPAKIIKRNLFVSQKQKSEAKPEEQPETKETAPKSSDSVAEPVIEESEPAIEKDFDEAIEPNFEESDNPPEESSTETNEENESPIEYLERKKRELLEKQNKDTPKKEENTNYFESEAEETAPKKETSDETELETDKKLTVTVNQKEEKNEQEEEPAYCPINTAIHEEDINFIPPGLDLLSEQNEKADVNDQELSMNAKILKEKLETFNIEIDKLNVTPGPVVTQYEFVPAPGIKVSKIENLADDIAMALKARGIRIIAPLPGKGTVGIEIPNKNPIMVKFSEIVKSQVYRDNNFKLPLALGKTIEGEVYCADLAKMPHLLIAGSTGSGKSVGINTIIASLVYKKRPDELKFVIVDPKKVELTQYNNLENHYLAVSPDINNNIITDPEEAVITLKAVCEEMDRRYDILSEAGQRNIADYNEKVRKGKLKKDGELNHRPMPYIVVIVDELADLMLTASKEIEAPIVRLAQLARAVGIHLVLATQRPSVDVITGLIKANFPARISYLVASKVDSRTILDASGAEKLLGNGDMLFLPGGSPEPKRMQNAFISSDEVEAICEHIGEQTGYSHPYELPSLIDNNEEGGAISKDDRDPHFAEAAKLVVRLQQGSVSIIQRRLKVGYARAGRIIDELEDAGVVGPHEGSKARQVLLESEAELEAII